MTPEQLKQSEIDYEAMKPHDLRDELGNAIWRVIRDSVGTVSVRFSFVDSGGDVILSQEFGVNNNFEKEMLFKFLATIRAEIENAPYEFKYAVYHHK